MAPAEADSGGWAGTSMAEWADAPLRLIALSVRSTMLRDGGGGGTKCPGMRCAGVFRELLRYSRDRPKEARLELELSPLSVRWNFF